MPNTINQLKTSLKTAGINGVQTIQAEALLLIAEQLQELNKNLAAATIVNNLTDANGSDGNLFSTSECIHAIEHIADKAND